MLVTPLIYQAAPQASESVTFSRREAADIDRALSWTAQVFGDEMVNEVDFQFVVASVKPRSKKSGSTIGLIKNDPQFFLNTLYKIAQALDGLVREGPACGNLPPPDISIPFIVDLILAGPGRAKKNVDPFSAEELKAKVLGNLKQCQ